MSKEEVYAEGPGISPRSRVMLIKCFALDTTAAQAGELAKVSRNTANLWFKHYREKIFEECRKAPRLYGSVEIDQGFFGGSGQKRSLAMVRRLAGLTTRDIVRRGKRKRPENKIMCLGMLLRGGDVYTHVIKKADAHTLLSTVRLVVEKGSTIYTDAWPAFSKLKLDGYKHESITHAIAYSDRRGKHINGIESFWSFAKTRMAKFRGISRRSILLHIKESEFRYNHKDMQVEMRRLFRRLR